MKTPEQLMADWSITPANIHLLSTDTLHSLVAAAMQVGVDNAREEMFSKLDDGTYCPMCGKRCQRYRRKLNSGMSRSIIDFYHRSFSHADSDGWVGVGKDYMGEKLSLAYYQWEFHKLRWWGLIEQKGEEKVEGHRSEFWRITPLGKDFVTMKSKVNSHAVEMHGNLLFLDGDLVSIDRTLGRNFNYAELMRGGRP